MKWNEIETATAQEIQALPEVRAELSEYSRSARDLTADCPFCNTKGAYVSTGDHPGTGEDTVHCSVCDEVFRIAW